MSKEPTVYDSLPSCNSTFASPPHSKSPGDGAVNTAKRVRANSATRKIALSEPDEELLQNRLAGRMLSPNLTKFLKNLASSRKWMRKIYIPSNHENLATAIIYTTDLNERGLVITCELHVFLEDTAIVEKWYVLEEDQPPRSLTKEMLRPLDIENVGLAGTLVFVRLKMPRHRGKNHVMVRIFDFAEGFQSPTFILNPAVQMLRDASSPGDDNSLQPVTSDSAAHARQGDMANSI